jgi:nucleoside 2-deoxyribosyltransferase
MSDPRIYLAGPDIFHPQGLALAEQKKLICERYGLEGVAASDFLAGVQFAGKPAGAAQLYRERLKVIEGCDGLIADMTPFRGPAMDPATAFAMGVAAGYGKPVAGYTLDPRPYAERIERMQVEIGAPTLRVGSKLVTPDGTAIEDFGVAESVMVAGAALARGAPIATDFESAVRWIRRLLRDG